jgi:hypothetical protein
MVIVLTDGVTGWPQHPVGCPVVAVVIARWEDLSRIRRPPEFIETVVVIAE